MDSERHKLPSGLTDNPELHKLVGELTEHVTAEAYFGAKKPNLSTHSLPVEQSPGEQTMPASPTVKSSLDPRASVDIGSILKTAQMALDCGMTELAISCFIQVLEYEPNNALALEGLEKARGKS